jgi:hypothetical protein
MTDNPRRAKGGGWAVLAVGLIIVALPLLYVASIGPAGHVVCSGTMRYETWKSAYRPILWAAEHSLQIDRSLIAYLFWCNGLPNEWLFRGVSGSSIEAPATHSLPAFACAAG